MRSESVLVICFFLFMGATSMAQYPYGSYPYGGSGYYPYGGYSGQYPYGGSGYYPYGGYRGRYPYGGSGYYPYGGYGGQYPSSDENGGMRFTVSASECEWLPANTKEVVGYRMKNCGPAGDSIVCSGNAKCRVSLNPSSGKSLTFSATLNNVMCVGTSNRSCPDPNTCVNQGGFLASVPFEKLIDRGHTLEPRRLPVDESESH